MPNLVPNKKVVKQELFLLDETLMDGWHDVMVYVPLCQNNENLLE